MKAGVASENGLVMRDIPQPKPKPNEVLVKVKAASLNRADLAVARGLPHGPNSGVGALVGIEWAGEVVETIVREARVVLTTLPRRVRLQ